MMTIEKPGKNGPSEIDQLLAIFFKDALASAAKTLSALLKNEVEIKNLTTKKTYDAASFIKKLTDSREQCVSQTITGDIEAATFLWLNPDERVSLMQAVLGPAYHSGMEESLYEDTILEISNCFVNAVVSELSNRLDLAVEIGLPQIGVQPLAENGDFGPDINGLEGALEGSIHFHSSGISIGYQQLLIISAEQAQQLAQSFSHYCARRGIALHDVGRISGDRS